MFNSHGMTWQGKLIAVAPIVAGVVYGLCALAGLVQRLQEGGAL